MATVKTHGGLSVSAQDGDLLTAVELDDCPYVCIQFGGTYNGTLSFQGSNDNSTWDSVCLNRADTATATVGVSSANNGSVAEVWEGIVPYKYFRVRMTSLSSGSVTGTIVRKPIQAVPIRAAAS